MIPEKSGDFLQWLRGFYFTVKSGGLGSAARQMGRTQSSISHQIKCLEADLGLQLFDRSGRSLKLTDEGSEVLAKAVQIFDTVMGMEGIARFHEKDYSGQINIVSTHAILLNFLPKYVTGFRMRHPDVSFLLDSGGYDYILDQISNADADFAVACPRSLPDNVTFSPLFDTNPVLVSPLDPIWEIPDEPLLAEIAHLPFVSFPVGTSIEDSVSKQFAAKGLSINSVLLLTHFEHVKSYVEMGMGVSILDDYTLTKYDYQRLRIYPLSDFDEVRTYGVITRQHAYLNQATRAFRESLYEQ